MCRGRKGGKWASIDVCFGGDLNLSRLEFCATANGQRELSARTLSSRGDFLFFHLCPPIQDYFIFCVCKGEGNFVRVGKPNTNFPIQFIILVRNIFRRVCGVCRGRSYSVWSGRTLVQSIFGSRVLFVSISLYILFGVQVQERNRQLIIWRKWFSCWWCACGDQFPREKYTLTERPVWGEGIRSAILDLHYFYKGKNRLTKFRVWCIYFGLTKWH